MEHLRKNRQIYDFYKMLLFLNESTSDYLFLWDMKENIFHFAKEMPANKEEGIEGGFSYTVYSVLEMVCPGDRSKVENTLRNTMEGNYDSIDLDFKYLDQYKKKCWINCRAKVLRQENHQPFVMIGCLSRKVFADKIDLLTGLMNYNKMLENLDSNISNDICGHFMILGIDNFRDTNQRMGRSYGNDMLIKIANILENMNCTAYRLDGDHFGIDLPGCSRRDAEKFFGVFQKKTEELCSFSAGVVSYPLETEKDVSILVSYAENALGKAKNAGKNRMEYFSGEDYDKDLFRIKIRQEITESIKNGFHGFELYYQPQVSSNVYQLCGAEALLRYRSDKLGFLSPAEFIPILERSGMIIPVGQWVLEEALRQCARWRKIKPDFNISVNMSYVQLREASIVETVKRIVQNSGVPGSALTLELTESMQLQNYNYFNNIFYQWREKGIQISIDDFGTGYSSLGYLKSLDVDEIKIDRCFVSHIQNSAYNYKLLSNILELAHSAHIQVCCEGVEQEEELFCLDKMFPELIQGFLFGKPVPSDAFEQMYLTENSEYHKLITRLTGKNEKEKNRTSDVTDPEWKYRNMKNAMNSLDCAVYIIDAQSCELQYMNAACRQLTGRSDYRGKKCYQLIADKNKRCSSCRMDGQEPDECASVKVLMERFGENMIIRKRLLKWDGKPAVLVIARNMEEEFENLSSRVNNQLEEAYSIIKMFDKVLLSEDTEAFMNSLLKYLGNFYRCDRVTLFLRDKSLDIWQNTFSWKEKGIMDKNRYLELTTYERIKPWIALIEKEHDVFFQSGETEGNSNKDIRRELDTLGISNCMMCAIRFREEITGILILDNIDRYSENRTLLKQAAAIVEKKLFGKNEHVDEDRLLRRFIEKKMDHEILSYSKMGLWQIKIDRDNENYIMIADDNMKKLLGVSEKADPSACFHWWYSRIGGGFCHYVDNAVETMISTDRIVETEYTWIHPTRGEVTARCVGKKTGEKNGVIILEGYHRILEDMERIRILTGNHSYEYFEFHEDSDSIYFHSDRLLFFGSARKEENFPESWIQEKIVHPDSARSFADFFTNVSSVEGRRTIEVQLLDKQREYQWFRLVASCPRKDERDKDTMLVSALPV